MFEEYVDGKSVYDSSGLLGRQTYDGTARPDPLILPDAAILQAPSSTSGPPRSTWPSRGRTRAP